MNEGMKQKEEASTQWQGRKVHERVATSKARAPAVGNGAHNGICYGVYDGCD